MNKLPLRHQVLSTSSTLRLATTVATTAIAAVIANAGAALGNARLGAMGDVVTVREASAQANVAFRAIPAPADQPRVISLPLGLAQVAFAPPSFNTDDPDFSVVELINLALEPPMDIKLISPPTGGDSVIEVRVAKDEITIDLGDLQSLVPSDPFRRGGRFATDVVGSSVGFVHFGLAPFVVARTDIDFSSDLHRALDAAEPLSSNGVYTLDPDAEVQAALAFGISIAGQVAGPPLPGADAGGKEDPEAADSGLNSAANDVAFDDGVGPWRLFAGAGFKPLFGLAYFQHLGTFEVIPAEPLLDPDDPTELTLNSTFRTSVPGSPGTLGQGFALDLGIAALYGSTWEVGLGVTDLAGSIRWRTEVVGMTIDPVTGELVSETIAENETHRSRLTPQTTLNVARHWQALTVAADVRHGIDGTSWHMGAEKRLGKVFALRGGALVDGANNLQGTGGGGFRLGPIGLDGALSTSSSNLTEKRALLLGLSLAIY